MQKAWSIPSASQYYKKTKIQLGCLVQDNGRIIFLLFVFGLQLRRQFKAHYRLHSEIR